MNLTVSWLGEPTFRLKSMLQEKEKQKINESIDVDETKRIAAEFGDVFYELLEEISADQIKKLAAITARWKNKISEV